MFCKISKNPMSLIIFKMFELVYINLKFLLCKKGNQVSELWSNVISGGIFRKTQSFVSDRDQNEKNLR